MHGALDGHAVDGVDAVENDELLARLRGASIASPIVEM